MQSNLPSNSPFASVNWIDVKKSAIHFALVALISFALYFIDQIVPQMQFTGQYAVYLPLISTGADLLRRYLTNYQTTI